jgi:serine/threonine protein kinase
MQSWCKEFATGGIVDDRWRIKSRLDNVGGLFNRGIYLVEDVCEEEPELKVMKVMPSEVMHPGLAKREAEFVARLQKHPNIVQGYDALISEDPHVGLGMVAELCDAGTLESLVREYAEQGKRIPELFIWQMFEGLVDSLCYSHHGPKDSAGDWDSISHRDIILPNVFLRTASGNGEDYPFDVKLADWGCAITDSEMLAKQLDVNDLPAIEVCPPEGALPSELGDIYQVGNLILFLVAFCISRNPEQRPSAASLLDQLRDTTSTLVERGDLKHEELIDIV